MGDVLAVAEHRWIEVALLAQEEAERGRFTDVLSEDALGACALIALVILGTVVLALVTGWLTQDLLIGVLALLLGLGANVLVYIGLLVVWSYLPPGRVAHAGLLVQFCALVLTPVVVTVLLVRAHD